MPTHIELVNVSGKKVQESVDDVAARLHRALSEGETFVVFTNAEGGGKVGVKAADVRQFFEVP